MTTTYIALLRGINVGGHNSIAMEDLRQFVAGLGYDGVQTLLQTGNVVFSGKPRSLASIERALEAEAKTRLGIETSFFVRTARDWQGIVAQNPFPAEARSDPGHLLVLFLKDAPRPKAIKALKDAIKGPETLRARGPQLYVLYPQGMGRSKFTSNLIERKLNTRATGRNWNTVLKLASLANATTP